MTPLPPHRTTRPPGNLSFRRRITIASAPPQARAAAPMMPKTPCQRLVRRQNLDPDRRPAANHRGQSSPYSRRRPDKSP